MQDLELKHAVQQSAYISEALQDILGSEASVDKRGRLAMAYLNLSLDHREATLLLVSSGAFASATALQRPLLEAFVTGAWLDSAATDDEVQTITALSRPPPKFEKMAQQLRKKHVLGNWFEVLRGHYDILGDYTHGHRRQLSRWLTSNTIEPRYNNGQMAEILRYADFVGIAAAIHREKIANRPIAQLLQMATTLMSRDERPKTNDHADLRDQLQAAIGDQRN
jgi:hypothetical protein